MAKQGRPALVGAPPVLGGQPPKPVNPTGMLPVAGLTGESHPTPEDLPTRKPSIVQSKLAATTELSS